MDIVARAELEVAAPLSQVFAHFVDFPRWSQWMPAIFTPVSGPERSLRQGDKFKVRIGKLPVSLEVVSLLHDAAFGWRGGSPWIVQGTHTFQFEASGAKTLIRSTELLSGKLLFKSFSERVANDASREAVHLMQRFASYLARTYVPDPLQVA